MQQAVTERAMTIVDLALVEATAESLEGYGNLVADPDGQDIEIVRWPAQGRRPVDPDTGDEGGTTEGDFVFWWQGDVLYGRNEAVGDEYLLGWTCDPRHASRARVTVKRERILIRHANYHPDGGQLFFPLQPGPYVVPLALPGDDVRPEDFVAFWFDGSRGLYIHPNIWHEAVFPPADQARFYDRQGKVHARVSVQFDDEFDCLVSVPLRAPGE